MENNLNPFLSIWRQPRATIRYLLVNKTFLYLAIISFFGAWASALLVTVNQSNSLDYEGVNFTKPSLLNELFGSIFSGIATVFIGAAFIAFFYWIIGKIFGGKGVYMDFYKGSMLTMLPYGVILPLLLLWLVIAPNSFYDLSDTSSVIGTIFLALFWVATVIISIFAFIITIVMISEVHQFSKWKAFFTMIIPIIIVIILIFALLALIATMLLGPIF